LEIMVPSRLKSCLSIETKLLVQLWISSQESFSLNCCKIWCAMRMSTLSLSNLSEMLSSICTIEISIPCRIASGIFISHFNFRRSWFLFDSILLYLLG
jgi:serine acetyltransferase